MCSASALVPATVSNQNVSYHKHTGIYIYAKVYLDLDQILGDVGWCMSVGNRVCNPLSGYSGYSDIRKYLSVRIAI